MPKHRNGIVTASTEIELIPILALLALQPPGDLYLFGVRPHTGQWGSVAKDTDTIALENELKSQLAGTVAALKAQEGSPRGAIAMKVLFVLGVGEKEKDLDNMLKWFMDVFKACVDVDDSMIAEIRAFKVRRTGGPGFIGLSLSTPSMFRMTDREHAQVELMRETKGKEPDTLDALLTAVLAVQERFAAMWPSPTKR